MNIVKYLFIVLVFISTLFSSQAESEKIAKMSAVPLYNIDKLALQGTIKPYFKSHNSIKAIKIVETLSKETYISLYRDKDGNVVEGEIPKHFKEITFTAKSYYNGEKTGDIYLYYIDKNSLFSPEEKLYLELKEKITIGAMNNWAPMNFIDFRGKSSGIGNDLVKALNKKLNDKLVVVSGRWKDLLEKTKNAEIDAVMDITQNPARDKDYLFTAPYLRIPHYIIAKKDTEFLKDLESLNGKTLALEKGFYTIKYLQEFYPDIKIKEYETTSLCLNAVSNSEADAYLGNRAVAVYTMAQEFIENLKLHGRDVTRRGSILAFGTAKQNIQLISILQKALDDIPQEELNSIFKKWSSEKRVDLGLTEEEKNYLKSKKFLSIATASESWTPFIFDGINGNKTGLEMDYLYLLESRLNIPIEMSYIPWSEVVKKAKKHEFDAIFPASITEDRKPFLNFSHSYNFSPIAVFTKSEQAQNSNWRQFQGKKIAVMKGSSYREIIKSNRPDIEVVDVVSVEEMLNKVNSGAVDGGIEMLPVFNYYSKKFNLNNVIKPFLLVYSEEQGGSKYGIRNDEPLLLSIINKAINSYSIEENREIKQRWEGVIPSKNENEILLTNKEKQFLAKHPVIKVHNETSWAPYNFFEKGRARGLSIDYIKLLAKKVGLQIDFVTGPSWNEFIEQAKRKEIDVMLNIVQSKEREEYLNFTKPYAELLQSLFIKEGEEPITNVKELFGKTFAVPKGFYYEQKLRDEYPEINLLPVNDTLASIQAVSFGKADALLDLTAVVNYYKKKNSIENVVLGGTLGWEGGSLPIRIGVRKDWPELVSILNKALQNITEEEIDYIEDKWLFTNSSHKVERIPLTTEERKFIRENTISVGVEQWAPVIFSNNGKDIDGITGDVLKLIQSKTGLKVEVINKLWDPLLNEFKEKKIDLLPATYYTKERATYGLYTDGFFKMLDYIYVREDNNQIRSMEDLQGKKLAIPKGFGTIPKVREKFPEIEIVLTKDLRDSINRVLNGEVDALYDGQVAVEFKLQEDLITGLKGIPQKSFEAASLHFFVNTEKPILKEILQKALNSIPLYEINKIKSKWLLEHKIEKRNSSRLNLTEQERTWLENNPTIKVMNEVDWPPYDFDINGEATGYSIDYIKELAKIIGIELKFVKGTWSDLYTKFENKEIDLVHVFNKTAKREEKFLYTNAYTKPTMVISTLKDSSIKNIDDLRGKKIAGGKGWASTEYFKKKYPDTQIVEYKNISEMLKAISFGEVDGALDDMASTYYHIVQDKRVNIKVAFEIDLLDGSKDENFYMAVQKESLELQSIINKAMTAVSASTMEELNRKWFGSSTVQESIPEIKEEANTQTFWILIGAIAVFLVIAGISLVITRFVSDEFIAKNFGSLKFRFIALFVISLVIMLVSILVTFTLDENKKTVLKSADEDLRFVLNTTKNRLDSWIDERKNFLLQLGRDPKLNELTNRLLEIEKDKNSLTKAKEQREIREFFDDRRREFGELGFFIIDRDSISVASKRDTNIGTKNLIAKHKPDLLKRVFNGEAVFIPPIPSDVVIKTGESTKKHDREHLTMFFAVPIQDKNGNVIAALTQRLDVEGKLSQIVQSGRIGRTGESYIFNQNGSMLSGSRFTDELKKIGLLYQDEKSYDVIEIRDPGGNLLEGFVQKAPNKSLPLTKMAQHAISLNGQNSSTYSPIHSDVKGYRDYRGVKVLGAWIWNNELEIAIASEIDANEALSKYFILKQNLLIITVLTLLLSVISTMMLIILGEKATRSIHKANDELSKLVEAFDKNVIASKTDAKGVITYASDAFCEISGYTREELLGNTHSMLRHPEMKKELFEYLWMTIKANRVWKGTIKNRRKDGSFYWVYVIITPESDSEGVITGYSAIRQDITAQKEVEELTESLESKVEERTAELHESQKRFLTLFDSAPDSISIIKDGKYIDCNQKTLELFGVESREIYRSTKPSDYSPELQENGERSEILAPVRIQEAINKGYARFEWKHKRIDTDEVFDAEVILSMITLNKEPHIYAVVRDITERKRIQEELKEQSNYIDSIINSQSNFVLTTDGIMLRTANKAFFNFFDIKNVQDFIDNYGDCICDTFYRSAPSGYLQKMMGEEKWIDYIYNNPEKSHRAMIKKDGVDYIFTVTSDKVEYKGAELKTAVFTDITELEKVRQEVEATNKKINDSIEYASLIQHSLIPESNVMDKIFEDNFVIWHPRDVVGGDIYLYEEISETESVVMVIDCTGHGVPGAFVTMLVKAIERQIISTMVTSQEDISPAKVLKIFNNSMKHLLKQEDDESISNAGFDGGVLYYNKETQTVKYAGAKTPLFYFQNNESLTIKGDRESIGYKKSKKDFEFTDHIIDVSIPTKIYITTDGYLDQNGGDKGFPYGKKRFLKLIEESKDEAFADQKEILMYEMQKYEKGYDRNDDITVIGINIDNKEKMTKKDDSSWII